ncbi:MAG: HAMP domain-containing sensor histidine kinase [Novosphingobium sp.]|nr:HAMP domain-containing sensor histidine kinase [Novosphingobium sp.]
MGALTSTIAHELTQPLAAVANFARGLRRLLASHSPALSPVVGYTLDDIDAGVMRAADIVRHMRSLVEKSPIRRQVHSLADIVDDAVAIGLIDAASRGIECRVDIAEEADAVLVDEIQIQQVIVNLLRNAVDAMDGSAHPQIVIRSRLQGDWAEVQVSDKGGGLSKESLANLFKPFDSTKQGGMGVGLSICRTIIEAHGGKIWGENRSPSGACFKFTLPRASIPSYS